MAKGPMIIATQCRERVDAAIQRLVPSAGGLIAHRMSTHEARAHLLAG
jgi:hypothetical protein